MRRIGLLVFDGADLLDVGGPYEVLLTANRLAERHGDPPPFEVLVVGLTADPVSAYGGMGLVPHHALEDALPLDVLVVPGAVDVTGTLADPTLVDAVARASDTIGVMASVCTGAFLLGRAGLLADRAWTTHWEDVDELAREVGPTGARRDVRWVDAGDVVTGGGLSCGLDLGLHLVDRHADRELAVATARQIDHRWTPEPGAATPTG